jgi:acyl dehydratase
MSHEFTTAAFTRDRIRQFCVAMNDPNPVHDDVEFCRSIGLDGIIAPGGMSVIALAHSVERQTGLETVSNIDIEMRSPVREGERLRCIAIPSDADPTTFVVIAFVEDNRICAQGTVVADRQEGCQ